MAKESQQSSDSGSLQPDCSAARLEEVIEVAKRKAVKELNCLDWHEGNLIKWSIVERAIRDVIAVQQNDPDDRPDHLEPKKVSDEP